MWINYPLKGPSILGFPEPVLSYLSQIVKKQKAQNYFDVENNSTEDNPREMHSTILTLKLIKESFKKRKKKVS